MRTRASAPIPGRRQASGPRVLLVTAVLRVLALGVAGALLSSTDSRHHLVAPALADEGGHGKRNAGNGPGSGGGTGNGQGNAGGNGQGSAGGNSSGGSSGGSARGNSGGNPRGTNGRRARR